MWCRNVENAVQNCISKCKILCWSFRSVHKSNAHNLYLSQKAVLVYVNLEIKDTMQIC